MKIISALCVLLSIANHIIEVHTFQIYVNSYALQDDQNKDMSESPKAKKFMNFAKNIGLPFVHSSLEIGNQDPFDFQYNFTYCRGKKSYEFNYVQEYTLNDDKRANWEPSYIIDHTHAMAMERNLFCETNKSIEEIFEIMKRYAEPEYDILVRNCNNAAYDVANELCMHEEGFKKIKIPGFCTRVPKIGKFWNRSIGKIYKPAKI